MVRIKGENSDYKYDLETASIQTVEPLPEQLYLQLYVCPYDHPSPVESHHGPETCCYGTDHQCPETGVDQSAAGHALVRLDQKTGISLVTDRRNQIVLDQSGKIQLCPADEGQVEVHGPLIVQTHYEQTAVQLEVSDQGIRLQVGGATVSIDQAGNLDLTPASTGKVRIQGDVDIQGELHAQLSAALTQSITQSVLAKLGLPAGAII